LDIEKTLQAIASLATEGEVRQTLESLNERIRKAAFAAGWGPSVDVLPLDLEETIARWQAARRASTAGASEQ
jgi:hypothetical protein